MKKLFTLFTFILYFSCSQPQKNKPQETTKNIKYIYEATYLDNFKIGNPELVIKVQEMIQSIINKDYKKAGSYLSDNVVFALEDGSILEGKDECVKYMESYSSVEIENYQIAVNLALLDENGDEWVLLWDTANIVSKDGTSAGINWMETFRFKKGKIDYMNQFSKPRNKG
jgi:predicted SnoaL-like aldol condensation-catalyzing enzyme